MAFPIRSTSLAGATLLTLLLAGTACTKGAADASPATGAGAPGADAGGRGKARAVVLAPSDVATATQGPISEEVAVSGVLNPLETVDVRARIDGNLTCVYVREGQPVQAGELLARFEAVTQQSNSASAEAAVASARADVATADWNLTQSNDLFKAGAISEAEYRAAKQQADASHAKLAAAQAQLRGAAITERDTRVVAPMTGVIEKRNVDPGEHVTPGTSLFTMVRNSTLELAASVPERRANAIHTGETVRFSADGRSFDGTVARVSPTIDPTSRALTVYVDVPNPNGTLKGGSFATGGVVLRTVDHALLVPTGAIHQGADSSRTYVYRLAGGKISETPVTVGLVDERDGIAQITSGLQPGDQVVAGNVGTLSDGAPVQVVGGDRPARGH